MPFNVTYRCVCDVCGEIWIDDEYAEVCDTCEPANPDTDEDETLTFDQRHGPEFKEARTIALERADHKCERCGITNAEHKRRDDLFPPDGGLHAHHKTPTTEFEDRDVMNSVDNLEILCADCHGV